ncbi:MAG TPA: Gmad2 immunoglobulin-like domain-containing protein [Micromonosporaceae bacterium]|jgi:hypothetical protein
MNEDLLRRALEAEAARVEVQRDALATIRARIEERRTRWLPRRGTWFAIGATVATAAAAAVAVATCAPPPRATAPGNAGATVSLPSAAPTRSTSTPAGTATPSGTPVPPGGATGSLPVYYLADDAGTFRLYREFHPLPLGDGSPAAKTRSALTEMFAGAAYDPDYRSAWPTGARVRGVTVNGAEVTVDLTGVSPTGVPAGAAPQAVQQLVWTVGAVVGGDPGVRLLLDGAPVGTLWGVDVSGVLHRRSHLDAAGLVWLISPQEGQTVGRTFDVHIAGVVFEATVHLRVRQGDRTVHEEGVLLNAGPPSLGDAHVSLTLPPGTYTLEAYEPSAKDGSIQHLDDHTITVR